ncbi:MAG: hypothetical protein HY904_11850 [Deltaproteobacteria bacterium]|nr:hypothetical protein [Deltaproteobacteria bacterium]
MRGCIDTVRAIVASLKDKAEALAPAIEKHMKETNFMGMGGETLPNASTTLPVPGGLPSGDAVEEQSNSDEVDDEPAPRVQRERASGAPQQGRFMRFITWLLSIIAGFMSPSRYAVRPPASRPTLAPDTASDGARLVDNGRIWSPTKVEGGGSVVTDHTRLAEIFADSCRIALISLNPATAKERYALAVETFDQLMAGASPPEVKAGLRAQFDGLTASFPEQLALNEARALQAKAHGVKTSKRRLHHLRQCLDVLQRGMAERPGSGQLSAMAKDVTEEIRSLE